MSMIDIPGMQFDLGESIAMLRDPLQQFVAWEIASCAADSDRSDQFPSLDIRHLRTDAAGIPENGRMLMCRDSPASPPEA